MSRSLAACEGCLLVVDAAQGVEAQTLANVYLAVDNDLTIIPVLNKIDLPGQTFHFLYIEGHGIAFIADLYCILMGIFLGHSC